MCRLCKDINKREKKSINNISCPFLLQNTRKNNAAPQDCSLSLCNVECCLLSVNISNASLKLLILGVLQLFRLYTALASSSSSSSNSLKLTCWERNIQETVIISMQPEFLISFEFQTNQLNILLLILSEKRRGEKKIENFSLFLFVSLKSPFHDIYLNSLFPFKLEN